MNVFIAEKVIGAVQLLLEGSIPCKTLGICANVLMLVHPNDYLDYDETSNCVSTLNKAFKHWPKHSGNNLYPLPSCEYEYETEAEAYDRHSCQGDMWSGSYYATLRVELCHFVIDYLKRYYNLK